MPSVKKMAEYLTNESALNVKKTRYIQNSNLDDGNKGKF